MLGVGRMVHARRYNCRLYILGLCDNFVICEKEYERAYPRIVSSSQKTEQERFREMGFQLVNAAEKLRPDFNGNLTPVVIEQYRESVDVVITHSPTFEIELETGEERLCDKPDTSQELVSNLQFVQLQCLVQELSIKEIRQMAATYGFDVDGLIRTHIGGYLYPGGTIEDWIRRSSQTGVARYHNDGPKGDHQKIKLNILH